MPNARTTEQLGREIRRSRQQRGLSIRGLAEVADVDATWVSRLERGVYDKPDPRLLRNVAEALGITAGDLFIAAGYEDGGTLPHFAMYLRAKYDLADEAIDQLEAHFRLFDGRLRGEDRHGE